jgi:hypothetical protein
MESLGFSTVALINCEGLASGIETSLRATDDAAWDAWMDLNYRISKDNASHGAADHLLYIGRKV